MYSFLKVESVKTYHTLGLINELEREIGQNN